MPNSCNNADAWARGHRRKHGQDGRRTRCRRRPFGSCRKLCRESRSRSRRRLAPRNLATPCPIRTWWRNRRARCRSRCSGTGLCRAGPVFAGECNFGVGVTRDVECIAGKLFAPLVFGSYNLRNSDLLLALARVGEKHDRHFLGLTRRSRSGLQHRGLFPLPERQASDSCCCRAHQESTASRIRKTFLLVIVSGIEHLRLLLSTFRCRGWGTPDASALP